MSNNADETFTRTSPPLNRIVVKLGGPAPWEILTASTARELTIDLDDAIAAGALPDDWSEYATKLRAYADAVGAMNKKR